MDSKKQVLILLILSLLTLSSVIIKPSHAVDCPPIIGGKIAVYWGQYSESGEGTLTEACDSDLYNITAIAYLHVNGSEIKLDLRDHCPSGDCTALAPQIQHCQSKGIQVLLSVEIDSIDDPDSLATYLYNNFLSGQSGPLGAVALDGIDLAHLEYSTEPWEDLLKAIKNLSQGRNISLSAAPHCDTTSLDGALDHDNHLFDYLWVLYYGDWALCKLGVDALLESWTKWTSKPGLATTSVFLGLVASPESSAASFGYIDPGTLKSEVLPTVNESSNFGGVMLWNRYYDKETGYSADIKDAFVTKTCECVCHAAASRRFNSLLTRSA